MINKTEDNKTMIDKTNDNKTKREGHKDIGNRQQDRQQGKDRELTSFYLSLGC